MNLTGSYKKAFIVTASIALLTVAGCGGEKKAQEAAQQPEQAQPAAGAQQLPEGHPPTAPAMDQTQEQISKVQHANIKTQKTVALSDEVKKKWNEAKLEVIDAASGASQTISVKVGGDVKLKEGVRLKVESLVPDYAIAENRIESRSNEANNPAVLIELSENGKSVARGWVFRDFPEFNSFQDARFPVRLVLGKPGQAAAKK